MKSLWTPVWRRSASSAALCWLGLVSVRACGPDFPNRYFDLPSRGLERGAEGSFQFEIARGETGRATTLRAVNGGSEDGTRQQREDAEIGDLRRALQREKISDAAAILNQYASCRQHLKNATFLNAKSWASLPVGLPAEFRLYFEGAQYWRVGLISAAEARWKELLELPEKDRRERSTWAAFMLGRYWLRVTEGTYPSTPAADTAAAWFQRTREMARQGFSDSTGLAAASLGWEARARLDSADYPAATRLYLEQYRTGDDSALESLRRTAKRMADNPDPRVRRVIATDPDSRFVLLSFLVSEPSIFDEDEAERRQAERRELWAMTFEQAAVEPADGSGELALLSYQGGHFDLARHWAKVAGSHSAKALWVVAKLSLRGGDVQQGESALQAALAVGGLSDGEISLAYAELARLRLATNDPSGSLDAWLRGGHWEDAAYTAERVLTSDELCVFADGHAGLYSAELERSLRHLLARRLAREGSDERALRYYSEGTAVLYRSYLAEVRLGFDSSQTPEHRARALWEAARSMRAHGLDFVGTELEPDYAIYDGEFDYSPAEKARRALIGDKFGPTALELSRLDATQEPVQRYHYRYQAAKLAWWAASLLPNESDETATILATAGGWLKNRDPKAANPFYQELVLRCSHTDLGRAAADKHWFGAVPVPGESGGA